MSEQLRNERVRAISDLRILERFINFDLVYDAYQRIKKEVDKIEEILKTHDFPALIEIANVFEKDPLTVNGKNQITNGHEVFWACVCLGLENVCCKIDSSDPLEARSNISEDDPMVVVLGEIRPADNGDIKKRMETVCRKHEPKLKIQW